MPNTNPACDSPEIVQEIIKKAYNMRILTLCCVTKNLNSLELVDFKALKKAGLSLFQMTGCLF
jgi:dihydroorotase